MNYLRELLYRPKRTDKSLIARFFFADEALAGVAAELDSFDGRKDPERCTCLVNKLRSCQDKLLGICAEMLEQLEPGYSKRSREFRAKFPDDIMTDNLAGQLWFGAECLAAGSSILHKETESEQMRPLAKAVTRSLDTVRRLIREQCLSPLPEYTEKLREHLKIFDRMFADFEYNYVCCMVHVKSVKEYELHQDLIVLFSDTLIRALRQEMVTQDMVDECDPSLMFAIPRLAIVYGLLICPKGPLNVDRSNQDFPDLFLPFKNLLRKIRELLQTLNASEVMVLEMLLCQQEEPARIASKLKEVERMLENKEKTEEEKAQAMKLQAKLDSPEKVVPAPDEPAKSTVSSLTIHKLSLIPCVCEASPLEGQSQRSDELTFAGEIVDEILQEVFKRVSQESTVSKTRPDAFEIDCTQPEIKVSPTRRTAARENSDVIYCCTYTHQPQQNTRTQRSQGSRHSEHSGSSSHRRSEPTPALTPSVSSSSLSSSSLPPTSSDPCRVVAAHGGGLKRRNAKRDAKRVPFKYQKDRRSKFKSTEDLLHRLYVCISGAADQLQSNYAGDFRSILRAVFSMNATQDDPETPVEGVSVNDDVQDGASPTEVPRPTEQVLPPIDLATDALHHELGRNLYDQHLRQTGRNYEDLSNDEHEEEGARNQNGEQEGCEAEAGAVYGQNLGLHVSEDHLVNEFSVAPSSTEFYQTEPALLDIASGSREEAEITPEDGYELYIGRPPPWVPDSMAPICFGCSNQFTVIRRRHHCRACGGVFCNKCSSHSIPLPQFELNDPVRVCNRCHLLIDQGHSPTSDPVSPTQGTSWNRSFGMVT